MRSEFLLRTKLFVPLTEPDLLERERLTDVLAAGAGAFLILISAPAGSGKTSLIASFVRQAGVAVGWLSLDSGDDHPAIFISYLLEAFDTLHPGAGERARAMLRGSPPPEPELVARALIADLTSANVTGVVVIDDYHVVQDPAIHALLALLVDWTPAGVTLVVVSRSDPPLPLSRLRVRRRLIEIREADLRFDEAEAGEFIRRISGRDVSHQSLSMLASRTEGWAAGLQLAGLALRASRDPETFVSDFQGTHEYVADYLAEEVLAAVPAELQRFAVLSSLLDRLCGPLCDAALETSHSQALLEEMVRSNLFLVRLDDERRWFRYHHLFTDLLRQRAAGLDEGTRQAVLRRAASWCELNGVPDDAIRYAVRAGQIEHAAVIVARHGVEALAAGAAFRALQWTRLLPPEIVDSSPDHAVIAAWAHTLAEDYPPASSISSRAIQLLDASSRPYPHVPDADLHARLIRAGSDALEGGSLPALIDELASIRDSAPADNLPVLASSELMIGNLCLLLGRYEQGWLSNESALQIGQNMSSDLIRLAAITGLVGISVARGDVGRAIEIAEMELESRQSLDQVLGVQVANIHALVAFAWLDLGDEEAAAVALTRSQVALGHAPSLGDAWPPAQQLGRVRQAAFHSSSPVVYIGLAAFLGLLLRRGESRALNTYLERLEDAVALDPGHASDVVVDSARARLLFASGDRGRMQRWPRELESEGLRTFPFWRDMQRIASARLSLGAGDPGTAREQLSGLIRDIEKREPSFWLAEACVLHALACAELRLYDDEARSVDRALLLTNSAGRTGPWLEGGRGAVPLLERAVARGGSEVGVSHAVSLLARLGQHEQLWRERTDGLLSDRELAVLRLLAAGHTNQQIGKALYLAVGTVKKHTHNIFAKLGVPNRTSAVQTAQLRGLIAPVAASTPQDD